MIKNISFFKINTVEGDYCHNVLIHKTGEECLVLISATEDGFLLQCDNSGIEQNFPTEGTLKEFVEQNFISSSSTYCCD